MKPSAQLEREAERTRTDVASSLTELRERLRPGQLTDDVLAYAGGQTGQLLSTLGAQVAKNPLPAALIGAGIAWLYFSSREKSEYRSNGSFGDASSAGSTGESMLKRAATSVSESASEIYEDTVDAVSKVGDRVSKAARDAGQAASDIGTTVADKARGAAEDVSANAKRAANTTVQAADDAWAFLKDQPLLLMGLGLALGSAIGTALPRTQLEDRLVGDVSDRVKDRAEEVVAHELSNVRDVGERVMDAAAGETKSQLGRGSTTAERDQNADRAYGSSSEERSAMSGRKSIAGDG